MNQLQGTFFFLHCKTDVNLASLMAPNHSILLMRQGQDLLLVNSTYSICVTKVLKRFNKKFEEFKKEFLLQNLKFDNRILNDQNFDLSKVPGFDGRSIAHKIFPNFYFFNESDQILNRNKNDQNFLPIQLIEKNSDFESTLYYYWQVREYVKVFNPIAAYDVCVKYMPDELMQKSRFGTPMHCHTIPMQMMGLDLDNPITVCSFKKMLKYLSRHSNFETYRLYERPLTDEEKEVLE